MSNQFSGVGNLGQAPVLRTVQVDGEDRSVADLRVYFDRSVPQDDGSFEDEGGFWLSVSVWGARAESAVKVLRKGARIQVDGQLREESWEDAEGAEHRALRLTASRIATDPVCIESITYRPRTGAPTEMPGDPGEE
ncbi:single-stranded DNA-binding protein [Methylocaldum gracile]|jgi:single-strand DNA-binding protein|uniref:single-stranded DNA-binding protein n=1 Tax=Methylocaldum sp. 0917 TaxID=2485163 RepID=UPI0010612DB8